LSIQEVALMNGNLIGWEKALWRDDELPELPEEDGYGDEPETDDDTPPDLWGEEDDEDEDEDEEEDEDLP